MAFIESHESPVPHVNDAHQFSTVNGITVTRVEPGYAEGELIINENSFNPYGNVHGGALATLIDTVAGCCACSKGGSCVTASYSMEFLRPANGKRITCVSTPKKLGHTLTVIQSELYNDDHVLVATGTYTFFMFHKD